MKYININYNAKPSHHWWLFTISYQKYNRWSPIVFLSIISSESPEKYWFGSKIPTINEILVRDHLFHYFFYYHYYFQESSMDNFVKSPKLPEPRSSKKNCEQSDFHHVHIGMTKKKIKKIIIFDTSWDEIGVVTLGVIRGTWS